MTWTALTPPPATGAGKNTAAVVASCNAEGGRYRQTLRIVVRRTRVEGLVWWVAGQTVKVLQGAGQHAGMIRVEPDGPYTLKNNPGRYGKAAAFLPVALPGLPAKAQSATALQFDYNDDWIEITLPAWCKPAPAPVAAPAATPGAGPAKGVPFIGEGTRGHAELYAGRRPGGAVR